MFQSFAGVFAGEAARRSYLETNGGRATRTAGNTETAGSRALWRFLPMLWPKGEARAQGAGRRRRAAGARRQGDRRFVDALRATRRAVDRMSAHAAVRASSRRWSPLMRSARFGGVLSDNLRNAMFEKVGQDAARRLAGPGLPPSPRSVAALPPRAAHRLADQDRRARHQEHRHDALFPPVQHRPDGDRARRRSASSSASSSAPGWSPRRWRSSPSTSPSRAWSPTGARSIQRQMNDVDNRAIGARGRLAAQLRDGQIFRRRGARGQALRARPSAPSRAPRSATRSRSPGSTSASR